MAYQILKQQFPTDPTKGEPTFMVVEIWAAKLDDNDEIFTFDTIEEAETKKAELESNETTTRLYKITEI
jgi:hypothetical protein